MSILSDFEDRLERAVEGLFSGAFRSPVQPAEIAKTLARAMDDGRSVGIGKIYAPSAFTVSLSRQDAEQMGEFAPTLAAELSTFLKGHAREKGYALSGEPVVRFGMNDHLRLGRFETVAQMSAGDAAESPARRGQTLRTMSTVTVADVNHDVILEGARMVVGRLDGCDIRLSDANVSREHAAFVAVKEGWAILDLESTNGVFVNERKTTKALLKEGDSVRIGLTTLVYHEPGE
ncbi:MAG: DUF3662 and FHA domain-containing protein [Actinomycetota bacterium]|jgi:hypothetical protein|nr:DUF3662 and FHA domain-containing protein [Actinomycetota bacterium]